MSHLRNESSGHGPDFPPLEDTMTRTHRRGRLGYNRPRRPDRPEVSAVPDRVKIVVPGTIPSRIQGSRAWPSSSRTGDVTVYTDRPSSVEQQIERARGATILLNSRGAVGWPATSSASSRP